MAVVPPESRSQQNNREGPGKDCREQKQETAQDSGSPEKEESQDSRGYRLQGSKARAAGRVQGTVKSKDLRVPTSKAEEL